MMNLFTPPPAALSRMTAVFLMLSLVLSCSSCMQEQHADPGSTYHKGLPREAWRTREAYDTALLAHREKSRTEIPSSYWSPGIQRLSPLKVYVDRGNLVVVQSVAGGVEQGRYIGLPVAPFHPRAAWISRRHDEHGFVFRPAMGAGVFNYTRTAAPFFSK